MKTNNILRSSVSVLFCTSVLKLSSIFKASFILGSQCVYFGASSFLHPVIGAYAGISATCATFGLIFLVKMVWWHSFSWHLLAYHIPGLLAALAWARPHWILHIVLPIICMGLFIAHPVGFQAALYSSYWLIPMALYIAGRKHVLAQAFSSTFIAHAVGSVIWIYSIEMTSAQWLGLIPVVAVERCAFALGAAGVCYVIDALASMSKFGKKIHPQVIKGLHE